MRKPRNDAAIASSAIIPPLSSPPKAIIAVKGLTIEFETRRGRHLAVDDLSFSIGQGKVLGIVGESGSGKSISALAILGLVPPPGRVTGGHILYDGKDLTRLAPAEIAALRGRRIAYVSQSPRAALNPSFPIWRQMDATLKSCTPELARAARAIRADDLLQSVGFADAGRVLASYPHELSGGMCQRVCIAMALAGDPDLLIADEPTTALDVAVQMQILQMLRWLNKQQGLSILIVSHDLPLIRAIADDIVVMNHGQLVESGRVEDVMDNPQAPYTRDLIAAIPDPDHPRRRLLMADAI